LQPGNGDIRRYRYALWDLAALKWSADGTVAAISALFVPVSGAVYGKPPERFWRTPNVKDVGNIPMFMDCYFWCGWPDDTNTPPEYDGWQNRSDTDAINRFCATLQQAKKRCFAGLTN